jgi:ribosomal-protein-alanine N-acetyltransferase
MDLQYESTRLSVFEVSNEVDQWVKIIGGVDKDNRASSHLLTKLGFIEQPSDDDQTVFYEYKFPQLHS